MLKLKMLKIGWLVAIGLTALNVAADNTWANYHWARTTTPSFTLRVTDSVTSSWDSQLDNTLLEWTRSDSLDLTEIRADDSKTTRRQCRMVQGEIRVCNDSYGSNGWLGLATIGIDSFGHIDRGTAKLNDSYASYWKINGEKNHVMCQEVGHLLGLGHTSANGSSQKTCMDYSTDISSQWPNLHDFQMLQSFYAHTDPYNSYAGASAASTGSTGSGACAGPGNSCNGLDNVADIPPMGIRVNAGRYSETWVSPRSDGGLWIHQIRLAP